MDAQKWPVAQRRTARMVGNGPESPVPGNPRGRPQVFGHEQPAWDGGGGSESAMRAGGPLGQCEEARIDWHDRARKRLSSYGGGRGGRRGMSDEGLVFSGNTLDIVTSRAADLAQHVSWHAAARRIGTVHPIETRGGVPHHHVRSCRDKSNRPPPSTTHRRDGRPGHHMIPMCRK